MHSLVSVLYSHKSTRTIPELHFFRASVRRRNNAPFFRPVFILTPYFLFFLGSQSSLDSHHAVNCSALSQGACTSMYGACKYVSTDFGTSGYCTTLGCSDRYDNSSCHANGCASVGVDNLPPYDFVCFDSDAGEAIQKHCCGRGCVFCR